MPCALRDTLELSGALNLVFGVALRDSSKLVLACRNQRIDWSLFQCVQMLLNDASNESRSSGVICMRSARRLADDFVHAAERRDFGCRNAHRFRSLLLVGSVAPHDGGARFRSDDEVERVLEDQNAIADGKSQCAARPAFAADDGDGGNAQPSHYAEIARDSFGLTALLGAKAGVGAGEIDKADHGPPELLGDLHAAKSLPVALRMGHSEIALNALFGAAALPVADDHNFLVTEPRH